MKAKASSAFCEPETAGIKGTPEGNPVGACSALMNPKIWLIQIRPFEQYFVI